MLLFGIDTVLLVFFYLFVAADYMITLYSSIKLTLPTLVFWFLFERIFLNTSERTPQRTRIPLKQAIYFVGSNQPIFSIIML